MHSLFDWSETIEIDPECHEFEDCLLSKALGPYPTGTRIPRIVMNFEEGEISLLDEDEEEMWTGTLRITAGGDELRFLAGGRPEEVNILIFNYPGPVTLQAPFDVFQKGRVMKNIMIDYAHGDVEVETLGGNFIRYPLSVDVVV